MYRALDQAAKQPARPTPVDTDAAIVEIPAASVEIHRPPLVLTEAPFNEAHVHGELHDEELLDVDVGFFCCANAGESGSTG